MTLVLSASAWAAGRPATVTGWVHSAAGVAQMGAAVEIIAPGSLQAVRVFTDDKGHYSAKGLLPGIYHIRVTAPSFLPSVRENVNLRAGAERVVNLTLDTLFDAMQTLPRKPGASDDDDWNWTLRSYANRPILRLVNGRPEMISGESGDSRPLKGQVAFVAGASDDFNAASSGDMSTAFSVQSSVFSAGTLSFDGNVGYGTGTPGVVRAAYTHRMENGSTPQVALTMRRFATPDSVLHDGALQALALTTSDDFNLGSALEFKVGSELQAIQFMGRVTAARPFGSVTLHLSPDTVVEYKYATSEPNMRLEKGFDSAPADLSESSPRMSVLGGNPVLERARHQEIAISRRLGNTRLQGAVYYDHIANTMLTGVGDASSEVGNVLPDLYSQTFSFAGRELKTNGLRLVMQRTLPAGLTGTLDYAYGGVLDVAPNTSVDALGGAVRTVRRQAVAGKMSGTAPRLKTRWIASYRWINGNAITPVDMFDASPGQAGAYWNFFIRQPLPGSMFMVNHMEALLEVDNLLAQGYVPVVAKDGRTLYLVQAPRTLRGGLAFSF
jgi:carboxypeptidase family protein